MKRMSAIAWLTFIYVFMYVFVYIARARLCAGRSDLSFLFYRQLFVSKTQEGRYYFY